MPSSTRGPSHRFSYQPPSSRQRLSRLAEQGQPACRAHLRRGGSSSTRCPAGPRRTCGLCITMCATSLSSCGTPTPLRLGCSTARVTCGRSSRRRDSWTSPAWTLSSTCPRAQTQSGSRACGPCWCRSHPRRETQVNRRSQRHTTPRVRLG